MISTQVEAVIVSWILEQFDRLFAFVDQTVAGGYVLALSLICVLQYMLHVYRISQANRRTERFRSEMTELEDDFRSVQRERTLSRLENSILREFVSQTEIDRALELLMRRFVPNPTTGFAAFLRWNENGEQRYGVYQSRGFSDESARALHIDDDLLRQIVRNRVLAISAAELRGSALLANLSADDRIKVRNLNLAAVGESDELAGILISTSLYPPGAPQEQQIELTRRLMQSISTEFKRSQALRQQENRLRSTGEMLALRSIADRQFDSPLLMIREFLSGLTEKLGADRGVIYLRNQNRDGLGKPLVRGHRPEVDRSDLDPGIRACWQAFEDRLAERHLQDEEPFAYCRADLQAAGFHELIGGAVVVPLVRKGETIGVACFTKGANEPFSPAQTSLASWAGDFLAEMILKVLNQAIVEKHAREDGLTELANRRAFDQQIKRELQLARQTGDEVSLLLFDLDRFKSVNDTFGHQAGDLVLRTTAQLLKDESLAAVRAGDRVLVARYGGEEMAVLLPKVDTPAAQRIGESIRAAVEAATIHFQQNEIRVTISVGIAAYPGDAENVHELISAADAALYQAKQTGRNQVLTAADVPAERML